MNKPTIASVAVCCEMVADSWHRGCPSVWLLSPLTDKYIPPAHSKAQEVFYLGSMYSEDTFKSFLSLLHSAVFDYKVSGSRYALNNTALVGKLCWYVLVWLHLCITIGFEYYNTDTF